ncbi:MAG: response regulator transcription factor [Ilumatobacteraceae bacterium]|jgi:two-component system alkaline phosphatase synthesis response regulator PhoP
MPVMFVVSDDPDLRVFIEDAVGHRFRTASAASARDVQQRFGVADADFVVIDVPSTTCWQMEVVYEFARTTPVPWLVIGGDDSPSLCVLSLRLGADDFVPRTVDPEVLAARVHAVRRRVVAAVENTVVHAAGLTIDFAARAVTSDGEVVHLTPIEFDLLAYLAKHPRRALAREQLLAAVWGSEPKWQGVATVTEHVRRLRLKLGASEGVIATVYGIGYRFDPSVNTFGAASAAAGG